MDYVSRFQVARGDRVQCLLCPHLCLLASGQRGRCGGRENRTGQLISTNYGRVAALALDPIEKKPLYHFYPGTRILSLGPQGCNLRCLFCQNWQISQQETTTERTTPQDIVAMAQGMPGCIGLAFTYSEPLIWYDFVLDTASLAKEAGLKNVLVTNGFVNKGPLQELLAVVDGVNLDVKAFSNSFYEKYCGARLAPVLENAQLIAQRCHLELTYLIIPGLNDADGEITDFCRWVATALGRATPVHFTRYFPRYKLTIPPTPLSSLRRARRIGESLLDYVYLGNVGEESPTHCPRCGGVVVERQNYRVQSRLVHGRCPDCGQAVARVES